MSHQPCAATKTLGGTKDTVVLIIIGIHIIASTRLLALLFIDIMLSTRAFRPFLNRQMMFATSTGAGTFPFHSHGRSRLTQTPLARQFSSVDLGIPPPPTSHHPHTPLETSKGSIIYTETDEAPALATYSLLPVIAKVK